MEEYQIYTDKGETDEPIKFNTIKIESNENKYDLNIEANEDKLNFCLNDKETFPSVNYIRTMSFKEIKELNKVFTLLNSFYDFYDYLKSLSVNKKLNIKKSSNKISIIFYVEVLLKQQEIEIVLFQTKKDLNLNIKELCQELLDMKEKISEIDKTKENEINDLKNEMCKLKIETSKEINELKKQNEILREKIEKQNMEFNNLKSELKTMKILKEDNTNDKSTNKKPSGNLFGNEIPPKTNLFANQNNIAKIDPKDAYNFYQKNKQYMPSGQQMLTSNNKDENKSKVSGYGNLFG